MKDCTKEEKGSENEEVDFILSPAYLYFLLFEQVFSALLYDAKSMRGFENPIPAGRQMLSFLSISPLHHILLFHCFLSNHLVSYVAENVTTKETKKMIREGK